MIFKFKSLTPVWIGDAWQELPKNIRLSEIYGSCRFWFEVFLSCYKDKKFNTEFEIKLNSSLIKEDKKGKLFKGFLDDFLFGKDGWKGRVEIEIENFSKIFLGWGGLKFEDLSKRKKGWFIPKNVFNVTFTINFQKVFDDFVNNDLIEFWEIKNNQEILNNEIKDNFINLINDFACFLDKSGFVGGKWELGFGKIGLLENNKIDFKNIEKYFNENVVNNDNKNSSLFDLNNNEIKIFVKADIGSDFSEDNLKKYLKWKVDKRNEFRPENDNFFSKLERHYIFGSSKQDAKYPTGKNGFKLDIKELKNKTAFGSKLLPVFGKEKFYIISLTCLNKFNYDTPNDPDRKSQGKIKQK